MKAWLDMPAERVAGKVPTSGPFDDEPEEAAARTGEMQEAIYALAEALIAYREGVAGR